MKTVTVTRNNGTTYQTTQAWATNNTEVLTKNGQKVAEDKAEEKGEDVVLKPLVEGSPDKKNK